MSQDLYNEIVELIASILEVSKDELNEDTAIGDLNAWDSIHHLKIIAAIENKYNFRFSPEAMIETEDVGDLVSLVKERTS